MTFLVLIAAVTLLQVLHWRLLRWQLGIRWSRWIVAVTLLLHGAFAAHVALRLAGLAKHPATQLVEPMATTVKYYQLLAAMNLVFGGGTLWLHRHWRRRREEPVDQGRRMALGAGLGLGTTILAAGSWKGHRNARGMPSVVRETLLLEALPPAFDGLKVVFLTDLHAGPMLVSGQVGSWRTMAEGESPDLLLFGGDFVDSQAEEAREIADVFRGFPAPLGLFGVLGNHDFFTNPQGVLRELEGGGIRCLENQWVWIERQGARMALVGLQDPMAAYTLRPGGPVGVGPDPQQAIRGLPPDAFRIALCHRPSRWNQAKATGAALTLSGHTHGGQINVIPGFSSARLMGDKVQGLYREGPHQLYVSAGLGVVALPVRLAAPAELTVLTLRRP